MAQAIDINELMERIRREAERRRVEAMHGSGNIAALLPTVRTLPRPPAVGWRRKVDAKKERLDKMVALAREKTDGKEGRPKLFRSLARRQGSYNRIVIDAIGLLVNSNAQLNKQVRELTEAFDTQTHWLDVLADHRRADKSWMQAAAQWMARTELAVSELNELRQLQSRMAALESSRTQQEQIVSTLETHLQSVLRTVNSLGLKEEESEKARVNFAATMQARTTEAETKQLEMFKSLTAMQSEIARLANSSTQAQAELAQLLGRYKECQANDAAFRKAELNRIRRASNG